MPYGAICRRVARRPNRRPLPVPWPSLRQKLQSRGAPVRIRLVSIYTLAAVTASAVTTFLYFQIPGIEFSALRVFTMWYGFCWPLAPTIAALLALPLQRALLLALGYYAAGTVVILLWSLFSVVVLGRQDVSPLGNVDGYTVLLLIVAAGPFAVIM